MALKKKWMRRLFGRRLFVALLLLLQLAIFLYLLFSASEASEVFGFVLTVVSIFVALGVVGSRVKPAFKLTWLISVLTFPIFGGLFYLIWELQKPGGGLPARLSRLEEESRPLFGGTEEALEKAIARYPDHTRQLRYLQTTAGFPVRSDSDAVYFATGRGMFEAMLDAMNQAQRYIFLEYFIIEDGEMWSAMIEVLKRKAAEGVTVRVMYDDFGCFLRLPDDFARTLTGWGIECTVFNPFRPIFTSTQNNRDHRKILSVDGKIAFTGGVNLADEYIGVKQSLGRWKDAGIQVDGSAAWSLTLIFLELWSGTVNLHEDFARWKPTADMPRGEECGLVLPYSDSPTDTENVGEHVYLNIINSAKRYVYIMTPYLILDDGVISALCLAAKSGTDVRILTPQIPDKRLVHRTTRSYYPDLLAAGVRIYEYTGGFLHAKVFVSDDETATVGSTNLDFRSLYLHFECGVWMCDNRAVLAAREDFLDTLKDSAEIRAEDVRVTWWRGLCNQALRLIAPFL